MTPDPLPADLLAEAPATKFLYAWLLPQGLVDYPVRAVAEHTGLSYRSVSAGLARLRALSLLEEVQPKNGPERRVYRARKGP